MGDKLRKLRGIRASEWGIILGERMTLERKGYGRIEGGAVNGESIWFKSTLR